MKPIKTYWPFLAGLITGLHFISFSVLGTGLEYFPGDLIDGRFNNYILEHGYKFFTGQVNSFWNAPFMYPEQDVITYSDNLLGTAPFYSVFRLFGFDRETSFQLWYVLIVVLNYTCAYFLLDYLFKNKYASTLGAFVFAFSLALNSQMGHAQTYPRFAIPLAFWMGLCFIKELKPVYFFGMLLLWVYQMYCGIYLGFMLMMPLLCFIVLSGFFYRNLYQEKLKDRKWIRLMSGASMISILLVLPLMLPYLERARDTGFYPYENIHESLPTVYSFFFSWTGSLFWGSLEGTCISYPAFWDHEIFAGGMATICLLVVGGFFILRAIKKNAVNSVSIGKPMLLVFITGSITFLLFIRFGEFSLYRIIYNLPGYGSMRALQRIINIELLFYALATAGLLHLILKKENFLTGLTFLILLCLITGDNYIKEERFIHHRLKHDSQLRVAALIEKMGKMPKTSILSYEPDSMDSQPMDYHLDAMLASQSLNIKTLNGYSATSPAGFSDFWMNPGEKSRMTWLSGKQVPATDVITIK